MFEGGKTRENHGSGQGKKEKKRIKKGWIENPNKRKEK